MKKYIATVILSTLMIVDVFAMNEKSTVFQSKRPLKRIDSRAKISVLKDKGLLPAPMSTEEYILMLVNFFNQNSQLVDSYALAATLLNDFSKLSKEAIFDLDKFRPNIDEEFPVGSVEEQNKFMHFAEGTDKFLPQNRIVRDISCPNVMKYVKKLLSLISNLDVRSHIVRFRLNSKRFRIRKPLFD